MVTVSMSDKDVRVGTLSNIKRQARLTGAEFDRIAEEEL